MIRKSHWGGETALQYFRTMALGVPDDALLRYNWGPPPSDADAGHDQAEVDAIYAEIIAKVPDGSSVLEIGCGGGQFAEALKTAKPGVTYKGIDIVPENISASEALLPDEEFHIGNVWEYLMEAPVDWDFVVSVGCVFTCTDGRFHSELFDLLNAKASKGFFILADPEMATPTFLTDKMTDALETSSNVTASYYEGARDFLVEADMKGLFHPFYIHRDGTTSEGLASLPGPTRMVSTGRYNRSIGRQDAKAALAVGDPAPDTTTGVTVDGGLVTGTESVDIDADWVPRVPKKG